MQRVRYSQRTATGSRGRARAAAGDELVLQVRYEQGRGCIRSARCELVWWRSEERAQGRKSGGGVVDFGWWQRKSSGDASRTEAFMQRLARVRSVEQREESEMQGVARGEAERGRLGSRR